MLEGGELVPARVISLLATIATTLLVADFVRLPSGTSTIEKLAEIRIELAELKETRDMRALGALYNRYHEVMLGVISNAALVRIHDLLYVQTARVWMQFLPEMDIDREIDVMAEEVGETMAALAEGSIGEVASVRADHMRRLLNRFNQHMTAFQVPSQAVVDGALRPVGGRAPPLAAA